MDDFTLHSPADGWIESNIRTFIDRVGAHRTAHDLEYGSGLCLCRLVYDLGAPPEFPYLRALSCYSAVVQLYVCSGQLPTAQRLYGRGKLESDSCRFGCWAAVEDEHHIFVQCAKFASYKAVARGEVVRFTKERCQEFVEKGILSQTGARELLHAAESLFVDDPGVWPLHCTAFYLGRVPKVAPLINPDRHYPGVELRRAAQVFASAWHLHSIRLAGRIWGQVQRIIAKEVDTAKKVITANGSLA